MNAHCTIEFHRLDRSPALEEAITKRVHELEHLHPALMTCHATVDEEGLHRHQGHRFTIRVDVRVKGHEYAFTRQHHEDPFVAVREVFDAAKRVLQDDIRLARGDVKQHAPTLRGRIARVNVKEGFGFIEAEDGREWYFGRDNVAHPAFDDLAPGQPVAFIEDNGADGPQAKRVSVQRSDEE
jgi:cold shock CspA family protein/ribosome-associated translation inhibitor RaiA